MQTAERAKADYEELITGYCNAWNETDAARRGDILDRVWAKDGTYIDPTVHARGANDVAALIGEVPAQYPGGRVVRTSAVDAHHGWLRFTWKMEFADGKSLLEGTDFGELSNDGKLRRIVGFFGALKAVPR